MYSQYQTPAYDDPPPKEQIADAIWQLLEHEVHTSLIGRISQNLGSAYLRLDPSYLVAVVAWMRTRFIVGDVAPLVERLDRMEQQLNTAVAWIGGASVGADLDNPDDAPAAAPHLDYDGEPL